MGNGKIELPEIAKRQALLDDPRTKEWANGNCERQAKLKEYEKQLARDKRIRAVTLLAWADKKIWKWLDYRENGKIADLRMGSGDDGKDAPVREFADQSVDDVASRDFGLGLDYDTIDWLEIEANLKSYCGANKMLWEFDELLVHWLHGKPVAAFRLAVPYRDGMKQTLLSIGAPAVRSAHEHIKRFRQFVAADIEREIEEKR